MRTAIPSNPSDETRLLLRVTALANRFASRLVDPDDADDLAQQVVLECLARLRCGRWHVRTSLRAFVRSMVRHRLIRNEDVANGRGGVDARYEEDRADGPPAWMDPAAMVEMKEAETIRERALADLSERCRAAYLLVREEEAPYRDVAAKLGISVGLVAYYVRNAERHLASRVLDRRVPSPSSRSVDHRSAAGRRPASGEAPRRRVPSAPHAGAIVKTTRATVKVARPRQMVSETRLIHARSTAKVAEPKPNYEKASPTVG